MSGELQVPDAWKRVPFCTQAHVPKEHQYRRIHRMTFSCRQLEKILGLTLRSDQQRGNALREMWELCGKDWLQQGCCTDDSRQYSRYCTLSHTLLHTPIYLICFYCAIFIFIFSLILPEERSFRCYFPFSHFHIFPQQTIIDFIYIYIYFEVSWQDRFSLPGSVSSDC